MEQEYGIGVTNRYALFLEESSHEEDPLDIIKNAEVEKAKKKTKALSGETKENKGKSTSGPTRKGQGIKETQNVKSADIGIGNKQKFHDVPVKSIKTTSGRKENERALVQDRSVKFASGPGDNAQNERASNRRNRDEKGQEFQQRNGVGPRRNFRENEGRKGEDGFRSARNDGDGNRGPRRDGERPYRNDNRNVDRQGSDAENRPPKREFRERRDFQEREGGEGDGRTDRERRPAGAPAKARGNRQGNAPPGGPRGFDNRGKREFERKSGSDKTGVKAVDKREGGGAHNWGTYKDDMDTVSHSLNSTTLSDDNAEWSEQKPFEPEPTTGEKEETTTTTTDTELAPPVEEEPKELTLDEWRALRGKRELPQYNLRKAGEGEDLTQWKDMYEIKKKKDSEEHEDEEEYDATEYPQRVGRQRHVLDIDITFSDSRRGPRGPRGGRAPRPAGMNAAPGSGRPRPREGPRRGPKDDKVDSFAAGREREFNTRGPRQSAPKVDDEHDFPSLG